jgi:hypothetical protein
MQAVAFDAGYASGPKYGQRLLRESGGDVGKALDMYRAHLREIAETVPGKAKYLKGWMHRVDRLEEFVGKQDGAAPDIATMADDGMAAADMAVRNADAEVARAGEAMSEAIAPQGDEAVAPQVRAELPEIPQLREDMFGDTTSAQIAQARADADVTGQEPAMTRQSVWEGARDQLIRQQGGEVHGALYHPEVGPIDVVWGDENTGLSKIVAKHPEVLADLPALIDNMGVKSASPNRVILQSLDHRAIVRLDYDGQAKTWLLSAYKVEGKAPKAADYRGAALDARDHSPAPGQRRI